MDFGNISGFFRKKSGHEHMQFGQLPPAMRVASKQTFGLRV